MSIWKPSEPEPSVSDVPTQQGIEVSESSRMGLAEVLFWFNILISTILGVILLVSPLLVANRNYLQEWLQILALFGHDRVVRRVTITAILGLVSTAFICFKPPGKRIINSSIFKTTKTRTKTVAGA